jgi:hypothetical protein
MKTNGLFLFISRRRRKIGLGRNDMQSSGLYFKHITIINDDCKWRSWVMPLLWRCSQLCLQRISHYTSRVINHAPNCGITFMIVMTVVLIINMLITTYQKVNPVHVVIKVTLSIKRPNGAGWFFSNWEF